MFLKILIFIYLLIYNLQFLLKWHIFLTKVVIILLFLSFLKKIPQLTNLNYLIVLLGLYSYILAFF